jgi:FkbM family methyltransferase
MQTIFDVGMHFGEDTEFYLRKGFRVVGIEAVDTHCSAVANRLADAIREGRLIIVNKAITSNEGLVRFYLNDAMSVWGTTKPEWAARNARLGAPSREVTVESTRLSTLIAQYGAPYYLKIDVEGADLECLASLEGCESLPRYVSIESNKTSWHELEHEFDVFETLGYTRFKVVNQATVTEQVPPKPAREGATIEHVFKGGESGLFGEETPGPWLSRAEALAVYRRIFRSYRLYGDDGLLRRSRIGRAILNAIDLRAPWYDTHAAR